MIVYSDRTQQARTWELIAEIERLAGVDRLVAFVRHANITHGLPQETTRLRVRVRGNPKTRRTNYWRYCSGAPERS